MSLNKFVTAITLAFVLLPSVASAHGPAGHTQYNDWVTPMVVGGVVGYLVAQPRTIVVQQPYYTPLPSYVPAEPVYQYQIIYDANCRCERRVLVQIN